MANTDDSIIHITLPTEDELHKIFRPPIKLPPVFHRPPQNTDLTTTVNYFLQQLENTLDPTVQPAFPRSFIDAQNHDFSFCEGVTDTFFDEYFKRLSCSFPFFFQLPPQPDTNDIYSFRTNQFSSPSDRTHSTPKKRCNTSTQLSPFHCFSIYDAPLLTLLCLTKTEEKGSLYTSNGETPFDNALHEHLQNRTNWTRLPTAFGVQIKRDKFNIRGYKTEKSSYYLLSCPNFCSLGRIAAYLRFIAAPNRTKKNKGTIVYQIRQLFKDNDFVYNQPFSSCDAWYYEMCTGLSLTAEISAVLDELASTHSIRTNWTDHRERVYLYILKEHRTWLTSCPAVTWRSVVIRNIFRHINSFFTSIGPDLVPPSPSEGYEYYKHRANYFFEHLFKKELSFLDDAFCVAYPPNEQPIYTEGFIKSGLHSFSLDCYKGYENQASDQFEKVSKQAAENLWRELDALYPAIDIVYRFISIAPPDLTGYSCDTSLDEKTFFIDTFSSHFLKYCQEYFSHEPGIETDHVLFPSILSPLLSLMSFSEITPTRAGWDLCKEVTDTFNTALKDTFGLQNQLPPAPFDLAQINGIYEKLAFTNHTGDNSSVHNKNKNFFRFSNQNHAKIDNYIKREKETDPIRASAKPDSQSPHEQLFQAVHDTLYPQGYIDVSV